jgi:periplasmic protein TonB
MNLNQSYNEIAEDKRNKRNGIITSVIIHALLILLLWFFGLPYLDPPPADEGILVNFGMTESGSGNQPSEIIHTPQEITPSETTPTPPTPQESVQEEVLTQEEEITAPIVKKTEPKKEEKKVIEPPVKETKTEPVKETKVEPKKEEPVVNERAMMTGKKSTNNNPNNQGISNGAGDQGKPWGDSKSSNYGDGHGLGDSGIGYDLGGRKKISLPKPEENSQIAGRVVIRIKVDQKGNVIDAVYQTKGSTTTSTGLINAAITAAKKAKFEADPNAQEVQFGTITYNFKVQ